MATGDQDTGLHAHTIPVFMDEKRGLDEVISHSAMEFSSLGRERGRVRERRHIPASHWEAWAFPSGSPVLLSPSERAVSLIETKHVICWYCS